MITKASGPDDWAAGELVRLPLAWWDALGQLWEKVLEVGSIPECWCDVKIVLIAKPDGGARPLSLTSVVWRIGAKLITRALRQWSVEWADNKVFGGVPERGVLDAHMLLLHAVQEPADGQTFV